MSTNCCKIELGEGVVTILTDQRKPNPKCLILIRSKIPERLRDLGTEDFGGWQGGIKATNDGTNLKSV